MKSILIACPSFDGKVVTNFTISVAETVRSTPEGYRVELCFRKFDSMLPRARNQIVEHFYKENYDYLFFIDSDQAWSSKDFWYMVRLAEKCEGVIGAPVRLKSDKIMYNVNCDYQIDPMSALVQVPGVGTGFMIIKKEIILQLKKEYGNKPLFDYSINENGELIGEDIHFCNLCNRSVIPVYIAPKTNVIHVDNMGKEYRADFQNWYKWEG